MMNRRERRKQKKLQTGRGSGSGVHGSVHGSVQSIVQDLFFQALERHQQGDPAGALEIYRRALEHDPQHADTLALAGIALCQMDDLESGIVHLQQSIAIHPGNLDAQYNLGHALEMTGRFEEAIAPYQMATKIEPNNVDAHFNLSSVYHALERDTEAAAHLRQVIALQPDHADAYSNLGTALKELKEFDEAEASFRKALSLKADDGVILSNLANILKEQNRLDESVEMHERALALQPGYAEGHGNFGNALAQQGKLDEALECFERALALKSDLFEARSNYCMALLKGGRFKDGWREYSTRWAWKGFDHPTRPFTHPHWTGEPLKGKTILVWGEQGIGDELMFASMFPDLLKQADKVLVECDSRLVPLFKRSFPDITSFAHDNPPDPALIKAAIDYQIPSGELGRYLRTDISAFPKHTGYIKANEKDVSTFRKKYNQLGNGATVVGVSWRSGNQDAGEKRSAGLELWGPILATPGCFFVNLQYGKVKPFLESFKAATDIEVYHDDDVDPLVNMDLFAAQIAATDLVISIDNSTVHTAGALGVPVWTLLAEAPDWRWMLNRDDSYWYPSMKLIRQNMQGSWDSVFETAEAALEKFMKHVNHTK